MIETITVESTGAVTAARVAGASGPAVLFVHGVGSTASIWDRQLEALSDRYRCAAIELRGNGVPPDPDPSAITREGYADDVLAVAEALAMPHFTIVGCSLGGVVAFEGWKRYPGRISAMVIVGSFAKYPNARAAADGIKEAVRSAGSMAAFAQARAAQLGLPPERLQETIEQMACKSIPSYLAATEATWTGDYLDLLPTITVPVLVARGEHDTVAPQALSETIAEGIPGARLELVPSAGHVANADNPSVFNAMLDGFLRASLAS
ncbi:MAG TPA: alpha/beta fold hydrolase [Candidatus Aquilonibacter sp.]|nr:alpha/beta fold hydrolase [Candidatus Aquilonibacter sp.]